MNIRLVEFRPPNIAKVLLVSAALLHWATPLSQMQLYSNPLLGLVTGLTGFGIMLLAWWLFQRFETAVCPTAPSARLVMSGIYRLTRNPMYLGVTGILLGVAFWFGSVPFYLAAATFFLVIRFVFCPYEERKLAEAFGAEYLEYKARVRRWI